MTNYIYSMNYNNFAHLDIFLPDHTTIWIQDPYEIRPDTSPDSILILHGGEDISPSIYNNKKNILTSAGNLPSERDRIELIAIAKAMKYNMHIFAICRGAQLLCAVAGGTLYQHVYGHRTTSHGLELINGDKTVVNSEHHQMMCLDELEEGVDYELIGWCANRSYSYNKQEAHTLQYFKESNVTLANVPKVDPEIVYFPKQKGFAIQGHPEWMRFDNPFIHKVYPFFKGITPEDIKAINYIPKNHSLVVVK